MNIFYPSKEKIYTSVACKLVCFYISAVYVNKSHSVHKVHCVRWTVCVMTEWIHSKNWICQQWTLQPVHWILKHSQQHLYSVHFVLHCIGILSWSRGGGCILLLYLCGIRINTSWVWKQTISVSVITKKRCCAQNYQTIITPPLKLGACTRSDTMETERPFFICYQGSDH